MREKPTNKPIIRSVYQLCMVAPACFGNTLQSSGSVPSAFWEMLNWGAVDRVLWIGVLCLVAWCVSLVKVKQNNRHKFMSLVMSVCSLWVASWGGRNSWRYKHCSRALFTLDVLIVTDCCLDTWKTSRYKKGANTSEVWMYSFTW
jgi:hypothetical protein